MKNTIDANYDSMTSPPGIIDRILRNQRQRLAKAFDEFSGTGSSESVLNVVLASTVACNKKSGLNPPGLPQENSRTVTYHIESPCLRGCHQSARVGHDRHTLHDAVHLPYTDGQFDWAFCGEVIEHVGSFERQYALVKELARVSRKGIFVTTSNRHHPIEFNTALPLLHWLPDSWWRLILKWLGKREWASEATLNLVDSATLYKIATLLPGKPKHDVGHKRVFGIKAHFFLMVHKSGATPTKSC